MFHAILFLERIMIRSWIILLSLGNLCAENAREEAFSYIYEAKVWGCNSDGEGASGGGSVEETTRQYRKFLQDFFAVYEIRSVVDAGCGDWEFSKLIDWRNIHYVGYDIVDSVIKRNQAKYTSGNIHFIHADAINEDLPSADLLICKDVLQHLSNSDILAFLPQLKKYKYCLITNDVDPRTLTSSNPDIQSGGYRQVDLTKPPFFLMGKKVLTFESAYNRKQVLFIKNTP